MSVVETERHGQVLVVRMNRPERLNALNHEMRTQLAETWTEFRHSDELEVAIFAGTGRAFCAGEDMKESLAAGAPGGRRGRLDGDELVAAHAGAPVGDGGGAGGGQTERAGALVQDDEIVAAAVHFYEARHAEGIGAGGERGRVSPRASAVRTWLPIEAVLPLKARTRPVRRS